MKLNQVVGTTLLAATCLALLPTPADAQRRAVRRVAPQRTVIVGGYAPFYWDPWVRYGGWYGSAWGPGWGGSGWGGPGWGGPGWGNGQRFYNGASLRLQVTPRTAEVYIDGYYAGTVDQFDGTFQRLRIEPGDHEVVVYADGYRALRQRLYLQPLGTVNVKQPLEPLQAGEVQEDRPAPSVPAASATSAPGTRRQQPATIRPRAPRDRTEQAALPQTQDANTGAVLAVRVQPGGADILIDGERWYGPDGDERLLVQLTPGSHQVEVRRAGYQSFSRTIELRAGQTETLNISLTRQ